MMYVYAHENETRRLKQSTRIWINVLLAVVLFCTFFSFYMPFMAGEEFADELDVFIIGNEVAHGAGMYKVTVSQHMPFSYYITAVITLLVHPHNPSMYRFCMYILLSALWTGMFFRYKKHINPAALVLLPLLYLCELGLYSNGSMMISEHWAGIGHAILLLELLCYAKTNRLHLSNCIWISASILLSFGCVFSSAYSVAFVAVGVFLYQIWKVFSTPKEQRDNVRKTILRDDGLLLLCVLAPWVILLGWYAVTGNIQSFIFSVYTLNVEIYSQYTGGLGTDAWGTFLNILPTFIGYLQRSVSALFAGDFSLNAIASVFYSVGPVVLSILFCFKSPILALAYFFSTISITVRGFDNFHALHFICAASLSACLLIGWAVRLPFRHWKNPLAYIACACGLFLAGQFIYPVIPSAAQTPSLIANAGLFAYSQEEQELVSAITSPGDKIHFTDFYTTTIDIDRPIDYGAACSSPWTWTGMGARELEALKTNETKMVFYDEGYSVWGYDRDEYAHELLEYIRDHYYPLSRRIYIRRSYLNEAIRRMIRNGYETYLEFWDATPLSDPASAGTVSLRDLASAGQACAVTVTPDSDMALELIEFWPSRNASEPFSDLTVRVLDAQTQEEVTSQTTSGKYFAPDEMNLVYFEDLNILSGHTYEIHFSLAGEGDVMLATAKTAENAYASVPLASTLSDGLTWRIAIETADPVYHEEEESYDEYDEYEGEGADAYEDEAAEGDEGEAWNGEFDDPFGSLGEDEYVEEEEEDDTEGV